MDTEPVDQPVVLGGALPGFATPQDDPPDQLEVTDPTEQLPDQPESRPTGLRQFLGLRNQRPPTPAAGIRTDTSSRGDAAAPVRIGAKEASVALAGLLGVVALAGAWIVQRRTRQERTLRQPSDDELDDIALPLARIAARFVPASVLVPTLTDGIMAASAAGAYVTNGPIIVPNVRIPKEPAE